MPQSPALRLHAALDLVGAVEADPRPADAVVSAFLRKRRGLDDSDRAVLLDRLDGVLRHRARLGWWLARTGCPDTPRCRLLAWLAMSEGLTGDAARRMLARGPDRDAGLSPREDAMLRALHGQPPSDAAMPEDLRLEVPDWAAAPLRARFGPDYATEMAAMLDPAALDLRVNTERTTRDAMLHALSEARLQPAPMTLAPHGIRLAARVSLTRVAPLRSGDVEIQDEGSQLVALLVGAGPGDRVVDFCAGAGGKTLALGAQMRNRGHITACDVSEGRLARCAARVRKAGLGNVQTRRLTSETDPWVKRHKGGYDRVLVDAPCSGTGTWRRNPDARWRSGKGDGLETLTALQARILASAARLVRPGGRLVYATCSLLGQENEDQVARFLEAHPGFRILPVDQVAPDSVPEGSGPYLSLTPARHGTDGFFAAVMIRDTASDRPTT